MITKCAPKDINSCKSDLKASSHGFLSRRFSRLVITSSRHDYPQEYLVLMPLNLTLSNVCVLQTLELSNFQSITKILNREGEPNLQCHGVEVQSFKGLHDPYVGEVAVPCKEDDWQSNMNLDNNLSWSKLSPWPSPINPYRYVPSFTENVGHTHVVDFMSSHKNVSEEVTFPMPKVKLDLTMSTEGQFDHNLPLMCNSFHANEGVRLQLALSTNS